MDFHTKEQRRQNLVELFKETRNIALKDPALMNDTNNMLKNVELYLEGYDALKDLHPVKNTDGKVHVVQDTTYSCAGKYAKEKHVAVLNFANAYRAGGGVTTGAVAQEECLCRSSNLYEALLHPYIQKHYYEWNMNHRCRAGFDSIVYVPGVTVFRNDEVYAQMLTQEDWFQTDVITCAAPQFNHPDLVDRSRLLHQHIKRGKNILEVAIAHDVDVLILGAFGCGAFHNPPDIVAEAYAELLYDQHYLDYFESVIFAIKKDKTGVNANYNAFKAVLDAE